MLLFIAADRNKAMSSGHYGNHVPALALDGIQSTYFYSDYEKYAWLQWYLPQQSNVYAVKIVNGPSSGTGYLANFEVRSGKKELASNFLGKIEINSLCGTFPGVAKAREVYTISCNYSITADYVSVQRMNIGRLQIAELAIITGSFVTILVINIHLLF